MTEDGHQPYGASADPIGLCKRCAHARVVEHPREGPDYWRCGLSDSDPRFPRYPRLPVQECSGFAPTDTTSHDTP